MEQGTYDVSPQGKMSNESYIHEDAARITEGKGMRMGEAVDVFGDLETAEDFGYVSRGSVQREFFASFENYQLNMMVDSNPDISNS